MIRQLGIRNTLLARRHHQRELRTRPVSAASECDSVDLSGHIHVSEEYINLGVLLKELKGLLRVTCLERFEASIGQHIDGR